MAQVHDIEFFGRVSASFTHEIKNRLATVSESAGLLGDLLDLAQEGRPLDVSELQSCRQAIEREVKRGFETVRTFNRFAHSSDEAVAEVGIGAVVELVTRLAQFKSYASEIALDLPQGEGPQVETRPLALERLLYEAVLAACRTVGAAGKVDVSVRPERQSLIVSIKGLDQSSANALMAVDGRAAAALLGASFAFDAGESILSIHLPQVMPSMRDEESDV